MKKILSVLILALPVLIFAQKKPVRNPPPKPVAPKQTIVNTATNNAAGYKIEITAKPYKNQWIYLAYYFGGIKGLQDSAMVNNESKAIFKSNKPLPQGIYIVASPEKSILFEMLVGEKQSFQVISDAANLNDIQYLNSEENKIFGEYSHFIAPRAQKGEEAKKALAQDSLKQLPNRAQLESTITQNFKEIEDYRNQVIEKDEDALLSVIFKSMKETQLPENLKHPVTRQDTINQYRFFKDHYWDNIDLMDGRLVRTPILEGKLKQYLNNYVSPEADSIIYEFNWMIALGRNDDEMFKYLIGYFVDNYVQPKIMGQDKVFLHVYERFIAGENPKVNWLNEKQKDAIQKRAYMLMANQIGAKAWDMNMVDVNNKARTLYNEKNDFTIVLFWDIHCGTCKAEIPVLDSFYQANWKKNKVGIYSVMINEDAVKEWPDYIAKNGKEWAHVHQTKALKESEEKAGKPSFRQLYDIRSTPTIFLLDKDKNILTKNITLNDLNNVLQEKIKQLNK